MDIAEQGALRRQRRREVSGRAAKRAERAPAFKDKILCFRRPGPVRRAQVKGAASASSAKRMLRPCTARGEFRGGRRGSCRRPRGQRCGTSR